MEETTCEGCNNIFSDDEGRSLCPTCRANEEELLLKSRRRQRRVAKRRPANQPTNTPSSGDQGGYNSNEEELGTNNQSMVADTSNEEDYVAQFLYRLGLADFLQIFQDESITTEADLRRLDKSDLKELGLKIGQRNLVLQELKKDTQEDGLYTKLEQVLSILVKETVYSARDRLDVWTPSKRTRSEQADWKAELIQYYDRRYVSDDRIVCMVLNKAYDRRDVVAAHIWKKATGGKYLNEFKLKATDVDNVRNGIVVCRGFEQAFDEKRVTFYWNPLQQQLEVYVLDPALSEELVFPSTSTKFKDIHMKKLHVPILDGEPRYPYRRLLNWHGRCSFRHAQEQGWIDDSVTYNDFYDLSDGSLTVFNEDDQMESFSTKS